MFPRFSMKLELSQIFLGMVLQNVRWLKDFCDRAQAHEGSSGISFSFWRNPMINYQTYTQEFNSFSISDKRKRKPPHDNMKLHSLPNLLTKHSQISNPELQNSYKIGKCNSVLKGLLSAFELCKTLEDNFVWLRLPCHFIIWGQTYYPGENKQSVILCQRCSETFSGKSRCFYFHRFHCCVSISFLGRVCLAWVLSQRKKKPHKYMCNFSFLFSHVSIPYICST